MNTTSYYAKVTNLQPISHGGRSASTGTLFNVEKVMYDDKPIEVPFVSGNSMKGVLRRVGMEFMASVLGWDTEAAGDAADGMETHNPLTDVRLATLWNGYILTSTGKRTVDLNLTTWLSELIPWLAIVGGCVGNQMIHGRIAVHPLTLICEENVERLLQMQKSINDRMEDGRIEILKDGDKLLSFRRHLQWQEFTHKDDLKDNRATRFLPQAEQTKLLESQVESQRERADSDFVDTEVGQHVQMRYSVQTINAMSRWFWAIDTFDLTPLMEDAFKTTMAAFLSRPYVGGNKRQGMGLVQVEWLGFNVIEPTRGRGGLEVGFAAGQQYVQHLQEHKEEIVKILGALK
jgi:hypothetical protein